MAEKMKAAVCTRYGGPEVFEVRMVPRPRVRPGDVLVRVYTTTVSAADWRISSSDTPGGYFVPMRLAMGIRAPRHPVLGIEFAGKVAEVGAEVGTFAVGDRVVGMMGFGMGAHAEYVALPASGSIAKLPPSLSFADAVAHPFGFVTAHHYLHQAYVCEGTHVAVVGASGSVGVSAVQLARHMGARVTAVCSGANAALVRGLGAERVRDYTAGESYTDGGGPYDAVLDAVGGTSFAEARTVLRAGGVFLAVVATLGQQVAALWSGWGGGPRMVGGVAESTPSMLEEMVRLAESGALRPVVDSEYTLDTIRAAVARVTTRRKRGTVLVHIRREEEDE